MYTIHCQFGFKNYNELQVGAQKYLSDFNNAEAEILVLHKETVSNYKYKFFNDNLICLNLSFLIKV